jgi:hypothetical protein
MVNESMWRNSHWPVVRMSLCMMMCILSRVGTAQGTVPHIVAQSSEASTTWALSAAEVAQRLRIKKAEVEAGIASSALTYPRDSMLAFVATTAAGWLTDLQKRPIAGIQLDPAGRVGVVAKHESVAKAQLAERLATPGLPINDRAFTYLTATEAFTDWQYPERLPTAESYVQQLQAMGDSAAVFEYMARDALTNAYYLLGRSADVVRHGTRVIELVGRMPFHNRSMFLPYGGRVYSQVMGAVAGMSDGRIHMTQLNEMLRTFTVPPASLVALDTAFIVMGQGYQDALQFLQSGMAQLGTPGKPLISNYWINRGSSRDSALVPVNDGKIRVISVGGPGCLACLNSLHGLQRLKHRFNDIEVVGCMHTSGAWANRLVEPADEADRLADHFINTMHLTIPVAIWKGPKQVNEDGGMTPADAGPNWKNYRLIVKPTLFILDGRGVVRHIRVGYRHDTEEQLARTIQFLELEASTNRGNLATTVATQSPR